jgi:uncharacterized protein YidB (DUF937 family)
MDFGAIINAAASTIKSDNNEATSALDITDIANALSSVLNGESVVDTVKNAMKNDDLTDTVTTWVKEGENRPLTEDRMEAFLGDGKVDEFAAKLGIDKSTASSSLISIIPMVIDQMTSRDKSIAEDILKPVGGFEGIIAMILKFFRR